MGIKTTGLIVSRPFPTYISCLSPWVKSVAGWLETFFSTDRERIGSGETRGKGKPVLVVEDSDDDEGGDDGEGEDGEAMAVPGALSQPQKWTWEETLRKLGARRRR